MRVVVLGPGAAGKSTFARSLGELTGINVVELDTVFWSPDLTPMSPEHWTERQGQLTAGESWILDGDLGPHDVLHPRLVRAEVVVMFDPPPLRCAWRAMRRSRERRDFWIWLLTWRRREKPRLVDAVRRHAPEAQLVVVASDAEVDRLLHELGDRDPD